ncbi:MAG: hypothetical protein JSS60_04395 [Verrucomicrobia bacterium]|nr:hypothetical protein [Verrucomicrobiota bacterium]
MSSQVGSSSDAIARPSAARSYDIPRELGPVETQIAILEQTVGSRFASPQQLQQLYFSTVRICAAYGREEETMKYLNQSEEKNIFGDKQEQRAQLFSSVVVILVQKGFHDKGHQLYKEALEKNLCAAHPTHFEAAKEALSAVGYSL